MGRYHYDSGATHKCNWVIIDARAGNILSGMTLIIRHRRC
jgi:hypothetical protein